MSAKHQLPKEAHAYSRVSRRPLRCRRCPRDGRLQQPGRLEADRAQPVRRDEAVPHDAALHAVRHPDPLGDRRGVQHGWLRQGVRRPRLRPDRHHQPVEAEQHVLRPRPHGRLQERDRVHDRRDHLRGDPQRRAGHARQGHHDGNGRPDGWEGTEAGLVHLLGRTRPGGYIRLPQELEAHGGSRPFRHNSFTDARQQHAGGHFRICRRDYHCLFCAFRCRRSHPVDSQDEDPHKWEQ